MLASSLMSYSTISLSSRQTAAIGIRRSPFLSTSPLGLPRLRRQLATAAEQPHMTTDPKKYSKTLILPRTTLPQRPPLARLQDKFGKLTTDELYAWQRLNNKGDEFVFLDGPPYANGSLHMGHALNKVLKDIINRYQVLQGSRVQFIPGWDCHGLPIENKALDELKGDFHSLAPAEIRSAAEKVAEKATISQRDTFKQLGVMADWSKDGTYRTLDTAYEIRQLETFQKMVSKGLIYRRHRPTYYSPSSRTALAEAELSYKDDHVSESAYVRLQVDTPSDALKATLKGTDLGGKKVGLPVWTTTPWSLASNMAIMVNGEIEYSLIKLARDGSVLVVATDCLAEMGDILGESTILATLSGTELDGTTYQPLFPSSSSFSVILSSHVSSSSGTGLVHCAPSHGADDYAAHRERFPDVALRCPIDDDGLFTSELEARFKGKPVLGEGAKEVLKWLREQKSACLLAVKKITHKYPYDWKTKQPVITRATSQWFANIDGIKESAVEALKDVTFVPPNSRSRLEAFVTGRSEWCISRQRAWGVPIPALYSSSSEPLLTDESLAHILPILAKNGTSYWWTAPVDEFLPPSLRGSSETWTKGTDTMDVWFDSGSAWTMLPDRTSQTKPRADVVLEGSDQHRGWFQSLLLTSIASADAPAGSTPKAPYGTVITHGFTLDEKNDKMSKSDGNVISPLDIIRGKKGDQTFKAFGTDALRIWAASCTYTSDTAVGSKVMGAAEARLQRYRILLKFMLGNLQHGTRDISSFAREDLSLADRWVLDKLHQYDHKIKTAYSDFFYSVVISDTTDLLSELSSVYFEMIRDTLYSEAKDDQSRLVIIAVLQCCLDFTSQSLAPITPYLAEEIYSHRTDLEKPSPSVFGRPWRSPDSSWVDEEARQEMAQLLALKSSVQGLLDQGRAEKKVAVARMAHLEICPDDGNLADLLDKHKSLLAEFFVVSHVTILSMPIDEPQSWEYSCSISSPGVAKDSDAKVALRIFPSSMAKCPRCWVYSAPREDTLCVRCESVIRDVESLA